MATEKERGDAKTASPSRPLVVIVDDEGAVLRALMRILRDLPIDVETFERADDALARCQSIEPRLVISDLRMPGMDGLQLLAAVRARWPRVRTVLHTGTPPDATTHFQVLQKPASRADVRALVQSALTE